MSLSNSNYFVLTWYNKFVMTGQYILSGYLTRALAQVEYDKLEDGTSFGRIPPCKGVVAFVDTLRGCEDELRSVLGD